MHNRELEKQVQALKSLIEKVNDSFIDDIEL